MLGINYKRNRHLRDAGQNRQINNENLTNEVTNI